MEEGDSKMQDSASLTILSKTQYMSHNYLHLLSSEQFFASSQLQFKFLLICHLFCFPHMYCKNTYTVSNLRTTALPTYFPSLTIPSLKKKNANRIKTTSYLCIHAISISLLLLPALPAAFCRAGQPCAWKPQQRPWASQGSMHADANRQLFIYSIPEHWT